MNIEYIDNIILLNLMFKFTSIKNIFNFSDNVNHKLKEIGIDISTKMDTSTADAEAAAAKSKAANSRPPP